MQNSAAIDEKAFEEDEEEKGGGNDSSPIYKVNNQNNAEEALPKKPKRAIISGTVFFKFTEEHIEKYHMCLKGSDLYCYDYETKKLIKFMHSLIGCFLISPTNKACENSQLDVNENINGQIYRRIELKLSQ